MASASSDPTARADRERLLDIITTILASGPRVAATWLAGSLGRGGGDDLCDIVIWAM